MGLSRLDIIAHSQVDSTGIAIWSSGSSYDKWMTSATLAALPTGSWVHLTFVYDAEKEIATLYKDGKNATLHAPDHPPP